MAQSCGRCTAHCLHEEEVRRAVGARLYHAQTLHGKPCRMERGDDLAEPFGEVYHHQSAAMAQGKRRRTDDIGERCRELMSCCRTRAHAECAAPDGAVGWIRKDDIVCRTRKKCGRVAIVALPHNDFLRESV